MDDACAAVFSDATSPYLRIVFAHLWPEVAALASVSVATRTGGSTIAEEMMSVALGPEASQMLGAPWLVVQHAFADPLVFLVGGNEKPAQMTCCKWSRLRDADNGGWKELPCSPLPVDRYQEHSAAICNGILYVSNDCDHQGKYNLLHQYNLIRNEWKPIAAPPTLPGCWHRRCGTLAEHEGRLYYSGGCMESKCEAHAEAHADEESGFVFVYDPKVDAWTLERHWHFPRSSHALCSFDGSLWVADVYAAYVERFIERCVGDIWQPVSEVCPVALALVKRTRTTHDTLKLLVAEDMSPGGERHLFMQFDLSAQLLRYSVVSDSWSMLTTPEGSDFVGSNSGRGDAVACGQEIAVFSQGRMQLVRYMAGCACADSMDNPDEPAVCEYKQLGELASSWCVAVATPIVHVVA